jgi:hypothetical protein
MQRVRDHFHAGLARIHSTAGFSTPVFSTPCFSTLFFLTLCLSTSCDFLPQPGDTEGDQRAAQWVHSGRLVVDTDPRLTIVRLGIDTLRDTARGHDVVLARFEFDPDHSGAGDEYAIAIGLDLGKVRRLRYGEPVALGGPTAPIPAFATITCLCRPLRPDSVRGTYTLSHRGMAQLTARVDARLYFTAWDDTSRHTTYRLRQRFEGLR